MPLTESWPIWFRRWKWWKSSENMSISSTYSAVAPKMVSALLNTEMFSYTRIDMYVHMHIITPMSRCYQRWIYSISLVMHLFTELNIHSLICRSPVCCRGVRSLWKSPRLFEVKATSKFWVWASLSDHYWRRSARRRQAADTQRPDSVLVPSGTRHGVPQSKTGQLQLQYSLKNNMMYQCYLWHSIYRLHTGPWKCF